MAPIRPSCAISASAAWIRPRSSCSPRCGVGGWASVRRASRCRLQTMRRPSPDEPRLGLCHGWCRAAPEAGGRALLAAVGASRASCYARTPRGILSSPDAKSVCIPERGDVPRSFLAFLLSLLPKSLLSSWVGRAVHAPLPPPVARRSVELFAHWYRINLAEAELPLAHYPTIGALFSRRLKPGVRPLGPGPVHPADALITAGGPIAQHTLLQGKGHTYTLAELVHNPPVASHVGEGRLLTYYLCPKDYHRVHAPVDGEVTWSCAIPGAFWPVNAWGVRQVPKLFCINERVVTLL